MSVFTVFCCGTGENRDSPKELIASLAKRAAGTEGEDWEIFDGPGTMGKPFSGSQATFRFPGIGHATGAGMGANVQKLMEELTKLEGKDAPIMVGRRAPVRKPFPRTINMVGWSRGAVTCHLMAHAIAEKFHGVRCNIFAIDPVPGPGNFGPKETSLPVIVENYHYLFQLDERRTTMLPTVPTIPRTTLIEFHPLPGTHHFGTKGSDQLTDVHILATYLAETFLTEHGSVIGSRREMTGYQVLETYARIAIDRPKYFNYKGRAKAGSERLAEVEQTRQASSFPTTINGRFVFPENDRYFVTRHHETLFKRTFPHAYPYLFPRLGKPRLTHDIQNDLLVFQRSCPMSWRYLDASGTKDALFRTQVWTEPRFKQETDLGMFAGRYKSLKELDKELARYHTISFLNVEARTTSLLSILVKLDEIDRDHERQGRASRRQEALNKLYRQARDEYETLQNEYVTDHGIAVGIRRR